MEQNSKRYVSDGELNHKLTAILYSKVLSVETFESEHSTVEIKIPKSAAYSDDFEQ